MTSDDVTTAGSTLWCAPGLGSQRTLGSIRSKLDPAFLRALDEGCNLGRTVGVDLGPVLFGTSEGELSRTLHALPAIVLLHHALVAQLRQDGVGPAPGDMLLGVSFGELSVLPQAGAVSLGDALRLGRAVGEAIEELRPHGSGAGCPMAVVFGLAEEAVRAACTALRQEGLPVEIANFLCPDRSVIAGEPAAVAAAIPRLKALPGADVVTLRVSAPFHTTLLRGVMDRVRAAPLAQGLEVGPFRHAVLSDQNGEPIPANREGVLQSVSHQLTGKVVLPSVLRRAWHRGARRVACMDPTGKGVLSLAEGNCSPETPWQVLDVRNPDHLRVLRQRTPPR
jgi:malonyl CoA-acyl carrier protein transacylase